MALVWRTRLLLAAVATLGCLVAGCSSSAPTDVSAPATTRTATATEPRRPSTTVAPVATAADLATMMLSPASNYWRARATIIDCSPGSVGCHVGDQAEIDIDTNCDDQGCTVHEILAATAGSSSGLGAGPSSPLINDGRGTWSGGYALTLDPFKCDGTNVPSRTTIQLHILAAQWLPYSGQFEATSIGGQIIEHGDAGGGCGNITVTYDFTADLR